MDAAFKQHKVMWDLLAQLYVVGADLIFIYIVSVECKIPTVSTVYCLIVSRVAFTYLAAALTAMCSVNVLVCSRGNQENLCLAWSGDQSIKEQLMPCLYFPYTKQCMCVCFMWVMEANMVSFSQCWFQKGLSHFLSVFCYMYFIAVFCTWSWNWCIISWSF